MAAASVIYVLLYKAALLWGSNQPNMLVFVVVSLCHNIPTIIAVRLRVKKKVQNLNAMWYKEFAKNFATQGDFGHESP